VKHPPNPIRSEAAAFGFLIWFVATAAIVVAIVLVVRALT
jgi:type IV secretory pathway TrbD component